MKIQRPSYEIWLQKPGEDVYKRQVYYNKGICRFQSDFVPNQA